MAIIYKCDRCEKIIDVHDADGRYVAPSRVHARGVSLSEEYEMHLCTDCFNALVEYLTHKDTSVGLSMQTIESVPFTPDIFEGFAAEKDPMKYRYRRCQNNG